MGSKKVPQARKARQIRETLRLSQGDVVRALSPLISMSHLSEWESGHKEMGERRLLLLSAFYRCTINELLAPISDKKEVEGREGKKATVSDEVVE